MMHPLSIALRSADHHPTTNPRRKRASELERPARQRLLRRLFRRSEPTTFQRCLAVHMHYAARNGVLQERS